MSQTTTYVREAARAFAGMLGDSFEPDILSLGNEEAVAVAFGLAVRQGTDGEKEFLLPSATGQEFAGVLVHTHSQDKPGELATTLGVDAGEVANVLRKGRIFVVVEEAIALTDSVFFRHTSGGGGSQLGAFRTDADTATADQLTQAKWLSVTSAAGIALLDVNYP